MEFNLPFVKDLGLEQTVLDALPYAVVGGAEDGSLTGPIADGSLKTLLNHIVPAGHQLKILFLRVWTQEVTGARFRIYQTNSAIAGQTGTTEAFPVVGNTPSGVRDYPFLEAPGAEVLRGSLRDPVHVCEGSIIFDILGATPVPATGGRYGIVWWGVESIPE